MLRSLSLPVFLLVFAALPAAAQTTDPNPPPPASQTQNPSASADAKKTKKVLTNEDLSNYEREPIEVQIRALQSKRKDLQAKLDALYDEARKKGVESGELP